MLQSQHIKKYGGANVRAVIYGTTKKKKNQNLFIVLIVITHSLKNNT